MNERACREGGIVRELQRERELAEWRVRMGMPEDSPDFSIEDVFDVLDFFVRREEERAWRRELRGAGKERRALAVSALTQGETAAGVERVAMLPPLPQAC